MLPSAFLAVLGIVFFMFKKPKLFFGLLLVLAGVGGYFYWKDPGKFKGFFCEKVGIFCGGSGTSSGTRAAGCNIDQKKYDQSEVYEPLAASSSKNNIPSKFSLRKYAPKRQNQGQQGSCVAWASAALDRRTAKRASVATIRIRFSPLISF